MRKLLLLIAICVLLTVSPLAAQENTKTLTWAFPADSTTFNTVLQQEVVDSYVQTLVFPQIATEHPETGEPMPSLATWDTSDDGLVYTFHINEDAVWSDGMPITAADVAFNINATRSDAVEGFRSVDNLEEVNVIDEKTLELVFSAPNCNLFSQIGFGIMPSHVFAEDYSDFSDNPFLLGPTVSGGPFVFSERAVDEFMRFEANDTYFAGRPLLDQIVIPVMPDPDVRFQALESGQVDFVDVLNADQAELLADNPDVTVLTRAINGFVVNLYNHADPADPMPAYDEEGNPVDQPPHPILGDVRVRQALAMAWDHEDALFLAGEGALPVVGGITPALPQYYHYDLEDYPFDTDAALALLAEVGWTDSDGDDILDRDGEPLALELIYLSSDTDLAAVMADYWGEIGVDVSLTTGEQGAMFGDRLGPQNFDMFILGASWSAPTPDILLNFLFNSANDFGTDFGSYVNEDFDSRMEFLATAGCAVEDRQSTYLEIQEILHETMPGDFIQAQVGRSGVNNRVTGLELSTWAISPSNTWDIVE